MSLNIREKKDSITIECRISPKSRKDSINNIHNGALSIALKAPPIENKANISLIKFLAKQLKIPKKNISLIKGSTSKNKVIEIQGISKDELESFLSNFDLA